MQGWCLEPDQSLTPSRTGVRARVRSGAHLRVRPRRDAGTAGVGAGLEPRAGAHWKMQPYGWRLGSERVGARAQDIRARPRHWRSELEPETQAEPEMEPESRPKPSGPREPGTDLRPGLVPTLAHSLELLVRGAESSVRGPSGAPGVHSRRGSPEPDTTRRKAGLHARAGGLPAATLLAQRPQPT